MMSDSEREQSDVEEGEHADFRHNLYNLINGIETQGSFATSGILDAFPNPGISVDGEPPISLPPSMDEARNLASRSSKSPFGKDRETLIDETVRKTLEISANRITFQNSKWAEFVKELVARVAGELGMSLASNNVYVRAELYKMLLYEPEAMFKAHKDTEKSSGMFATLVICLPSQHTGGTVALRHGESSHRLSTAESSAFDCSYVAWYADVLHEIEPVETGFRWVLTYNLINDSSSFRPSASALDSQIATLVQSLSQWETLQPSPQFLVYPLDHQYTARSLGLSSLKGADFQRINCLASSCVILGKFFLFLAQLELMKTWPNDECGDYESNRKSQRNLHHICNLEGSQLSPLKVEVQNSTLLRQVSYNNRQPDARTGGEYVGNQHRNFHETYSDAVVVIVPEHSLHAALCGSNHTPRHMGAVMKCLQKCISAEAPSTLRDILCRLCHIILDERFEAGGKKDEYLGHVAVTAAALGDPSLFYEAQQQTRNSWQGQRWIELGKIIDPQYPFVDSTSISVALRTCNTLQGDYLNLINFFHYGFRKYNPGRKDPVKLAESEHWFSNEIITILSTHTGCAMEEGDAGTLMEIVAGRPVKYIPERRQVIDDAVTKFVNNRKDESFVTELAIELLLDLSQVENAREVFLRHLLRSMLETAISTFDLNNWYTYLASATPKNLGNLTVAEHQHELGGIFRALYDELATNSVEAASRLLWKTSIQASKFDRISRADEVLFELIRQILPALDTGCPEVQHCLQLLMEAYIIRSIGQKPPKPTDWARPREVRRCSLNNCKPCAQLNAFLEDAEAEERMIQVGNAKEHMARNFESYRYLETKFMGRSDEKIHFKKTLKWWKEDDGYWELSAERVVQKLRGLPRDGLKEILNGKYNPILALVMARSEGSNDGKLVKDHLSDKDELSAPQNQTQNEGLGDTITAVDRKRARYN